MIYSNNNRQFNFIVSLLMWKQSNFVCDLRKHILNQCMASIPSFPVFNLILNSINYGPHCRMREQGAGDFVKDAFLVIDKYALYKCAVSLGFSVLFTSCSWHIVSKHPDGDGKRPQLKPLKLTNGWCHRSHILEFLLFSCCLTASSSAPSVQTISAMSL